MLARTLALRVKAQPIYSNSSVIKFSDKQQLIQSMLDQFVSDEETSKPDNGNSHEVNETLKYVDNDLSKLDKSKSDGNEYMQLDTQSLFATADHDPDLLGSVTTAKRISPGLTSDEVLNLDLGSAQLSTTKLTKHIKSE